MNDKQLIITGLTINTGDIHDFVIDQENREIIHINTGMMYQYLTENPVEACREIISNLENIKKWQEKKYFIQ